MRNYLKITLMAGVLLLLTGCTYFTAAPTVQPTTEIQVIVVTNTPTPEPNIVYLTATPAAGEVTETAAAQTGPTSTPLTGNASITVTSVDDQGGGRAVVHWTPIGDFPSGYVIVWSATNQLPTYPNDQFNYAGDPSTRSAMITGEVGKIYFLRVCRLVNNTCDVYSNLGIFTLSRVATATPIYRTPVGGTGYTATPKYNAYNSAGTPVSSSSGITITNITGTGYATGKAKITWLANGSFSSGFRIMYSTSYKNPYYVGYEYYVISDGTARSAYVDGTPGMTYYYRICKISGTTCDPYSNSYSFLYPGSTPTSVPTSLTQTPTKTPTMTLTPTMTNTPTVTLTATVTPTPTNTSTPVPPTVTSTPTQTSTPDGSTISISTDSVVDSADGQATISWTASGDFPLGFLILMSDSNNPPTISDTVLTAPNSSDRSRTIYGTPATTYHVLVCKYSGSGCTGVSSGVVDFTFGKISMSSFTDTTPGNATISWTTNKAFANGYKILASTTNASPTISDAIATAGSSAVSADISGIAGTKYYMRVCAYDGVSDCVLYSDTKEYTFARITLTSLTATSETNAHLVWTADGDFTNGFIWLSSIANDVPVLGQVGTDSGGLDGSLRVGNFTIVPGYHYYFRLCQQNASAECVIYSNVISADFPSSLVLARNPAEAETNATVTLNWTGPTGYSNFTHYRIYRGLTGDLAPTLLGTLTKTLFTYTDTLTVKGNYLYFICAYDNLSSKCRGVSNDLAVTYR
jgi:hypothetical protein